MDAFGITKTGWVEQHFGGAANETSYSTRYLTSMYFAFMTMTTVGYGDINATTVPEMIFAVMAMIIGGLTFGFIVGVLSELSSQNDLGDKFKNKQLGKVMAFMRGNQMKPILINKVQNYCPRRPGAVKRP